MKQFGGRGGLTLRWELDSGSGVDESDSEEEGDAIWSRLVIMAISGVEGSGSDKDGGTIVSNS